MFEVTKPGQIPKYSHDPQARLDYPVSWAPWLTDIDDTIVTASVKLGGVEADPLPFTDVIIIDEFFSDTTTTTAWVVGNGAELNGSHRITYHIITADGREEDQSIDLQIKEH